MQRERPCPGQFLPSIPPCKITSAELDFVSRGGGGNVNFHFILRKPVKGIPGGFPFNLMTSNDNHVLTPAQGYPSRNISLGWGRRSTRQKHFPANRLPFGKNHRTKWTAEALRPEGGYCRDPGNRDQFFFLFFIFIR